LTPVFDPEKEHWLR